MKMRPGFLCLTIMTAIQLSSCKDPDYQLPSDLFKIKSALDVGNNGNASDVRIELEAANTVIAPNVQDVRLILVKSSKSLIPAQIDGVMPGNYFSFPVSSVKNQTVKPTSALKDADGDAITNSSYKIYIAIIGRDNARQLSTFRELALENRPIYAGDYKGTWEDLGPPGPGTFTITLRINNDYSGKLFYSENFTPYGRGGSEDAKIIMTVNGSDFAFAMEQFIGQYLGGGSFGPGGGCLAAQNLSGTITDEINLVFNTFKWSDCDGTRDVKMRFTRQ